MNRDQRRALESIRLDWATTPDDIWESQSDVHVGGLHEHAYREVMAAFGDTELTRTKSPLGVVIPGPAGAGKTHLLGEIRASVQEQRGYFFLVDMLSGERFWSTILNTVLEDFSRPVVQTQRSQLQEMLWRLSEQAAIPEGERAPIVGQAPLDKEQLDTFIAAVFKVHAKYRRRAQNTLRALVLAAAEDQDVNDLGYILLQPHETDSSVLESLKPWGIQRVTMTDQDVVESISQLLALTGPSVMAVDQIDTVIGSSTKSTGQDGGGSDDHALEGFAHGLMSMRQNLHRTVTVVACLPAAWTQIENRATATVRDRFREAAPLQRIPNSDFARTMVEHRFQTCFRQVGYDAPSATWPVADVAFGEAKNYTPRSLLQNIDKHIRHCLNTDTVTDMKTLAFQNTSVEDPTPATRKSDPTDSALTKLDDEFDALKATADIADVLDGKKQDSAFPTLLLSGFRVLVQQSTRSDQTWSPDAVPSSKPSVHGRISRTDDADQETYQWYFRIVTTASPTSATSKIQKASDYANLDQQLPNRTVMLLRNDPWPSGPQTAQTVLKFHNAGGQTRPFTEGDIRILVALRALLTGKNADLGRWISSRKPASEISFFRDMISTAESTAVSSGPNPARAAAVAEDTQGEAQITLGLTSSGMPIELPLSALRKHTAIFAGSGSGKTVLIRRIVEECALQGVSSIIIDSNNDLARLSQPWPSDSTVHHDDDIIKRKLFFETTDVKVWTPNRSSGRPLMFHPLPDFAAIRDDNELFESAVDSAYSALSPRAVTGTSNKAMHGRAVLKEALRWFGRGNSGGLNDFINLLSDLPDDVSDLDDAGTLARGLAQNLKAQISIDPMFGESGTAADPGELLRPASGFKARVSIVNLSGLQSDLQREGFVNQLEMALFSWLRKNPSDKPLGGLLVIDEAQNFVPAGKQRVSSESTIALVSQARKYGLGMIFATQAPKGLDNKIPGNASTQFFGKLTAPAQTQAAEEVAKSRQSSMEGIGRLPAGTFFASLEGVDNGRFKKIKTPMCLTLHTSSAPTEDDVVEMARQ
ncbi:hypothetical protein CH286_08850 [Rhodococcus sp. WWJCD1]|uniref:ATP-binding protein n=1 Tax=Rhodococcus sp. WWJCD1 TaxID=2022519 RepID=UPI000B9A9A04|nr:DUF87 domain-containing protein [Rhodococcus sp. WWJCD1]OZC49609.1 hypothetical protein CH286_08850 [Rhodococcus sp. WWJCD1]